MSVLITGVAKMNDSGKLRFYCEEGPTYGYVDLEPDLASRPGIHFLVVDRFKTILEEHRGKASLGAN